MLEQIRKALISTGLYALVSQTEINTNHCAFHVECNEASCRQLFMHYKGAAALIAVKEVTSDYFEKGKAKTYHEFEFFLNYATIGKLVQMVFDPHDPKLLWNEREDGMKKIIPGYNTEFQVPEKFSGHVGMTWTNGGETAIHFNVHPRQNFDSFTAEEAAEMIKSVVDQVLIYLAKDFHYDEGPALYFPPHYTFPKCDQAFSDQFDWQYYRMLLRQKKRR
jgi:hypothetical protein